MTEEQLAALARIRSSRILFDEDLIEEGDGTPPRAIDLNDTFFWACADCEEIPDECLVEVDDLYSRYGLCGVYYWVCKRRGTWKVEFKDIQRMIDFVVREEGLRAEEPNSNRRAYRNLKYTLGE